MAPPRPLRRRGGVEFAADGRAGGPWLPPLADKRHRTGHNAGVCALVLYLGATEAPTRAELDAWPGWTLLEFGTGWCGHCRAAQPALAEALAQEGRWRHLRVEDGPGRALGRSFRVKLWPTLVLLRDGREVARLVRPQQTADISAALKAW